MSTVYVVSEHALDWDDYPMGLKNTVLITMDEALVREVRSKTRNGHTVHGRRGGITVEQYELGFIDDRFAEKIGLWSDD